MPELREFTVTLSGIPHTLQLDEAAAKRLKLDWDHKTAKPETKAVKPANKAVKPANK